MNHATSEPHFSVCVKEVDLKFAHPFSSSELQGMVDSLLCDLTSRLQEEGCRLIGHIKGVAESDKHGSLFFSVTDFGVSPHYCNHVFDPVHAAHITINVIVAGLQEETVLDALARAAARAFGDSLSPGQEASR